MNAEEDSINFRESQFTTKNSNFILNSKFYLF